MTSNISVGSHYVPAVGESLITKIVTDKINWKDRNFAFYERDQSFFHYPYLLVSAYYMLNGNIDQNFIKYPEDSLIIGDSGGYQILSFGRKGQSISITPLQVLRWLEENVDIGMNLDNPPDYAHFDKSLEKSIENFQFFQDNRINYNFKLYNILHGNNLDQIKTWHSAVKNFNFDGWALGIHPSTNIYLKIIAYLYLQEQQEPDLLTNCHFFGVSGPANMISTAMLSKYFNSAITFDSSSWSWGQRFRDFWFSNDIRHCVRLGRLFKNSMSGIPCDCPVCRTMSLGDLYNQASDGMTPFLLSYHNLYNYINVNNNINIMADDSEVLLEYCKSLGEESLFNNINNILNCNEQHGVNFTYEKYKDIINYQRCFVKNTRLPSFK